MEHLLPKNSTSVSKIQHKFFDRNLNNNLDDLAHFLHTQYDRIERGEILKNDKQEKTLWDSSGSITTQKWNKYNVFQFYHPGIHNLFKAVRSMTVEACEYYNVDFNKEQFWVQGWFNINYNHIGKLDWHEHGGAGAPWFHGYYAVKAEPSITHYKVFDKEIENHNKNNRAILSETGHPHAMGDWDWEGPRITIAYDVIPFRGVMHNWEQHWIPLA
jgi:hypothetical protein